MHQHFATVLKPNFHFCWLVSVASTQKAFALCAKSFEVFTLSHCFYLLKSCTEVTSAGDAKEGGCDRWSSYNILLFRWVCSSKEAGSVCGFTSLSWVIQCAEITHFMENFNTRVDFARPCSASPKTVSCMFLEKREGGQFQVMKHTHSQLARTTACIPRTGLLVI